MESQMDRFRIRFPPTAPWELNTKVQASPSSSRITSCDRCRHFKKKCSRVPPDCTNCIHAGLPCSLRISSTTTADNLRARLAWLEGIVNQSNLLGDRVIEHVPTGTDLAQLANTNLGQQQQSISTLPITSSPGTTVALTPIVAESSPPYQLMRLPLPNDTPEAQGGNDGPSPPKRIRLHEPSPTLHCLNEPSPTTSVATPQMKDPDANALVEAYFRDVHRAYPFINRDFVENALRTNRNQAPQLQDGQEILYLVMAVGFSTLQRAGHVPATTKWHFQVEYERVISQCLVQENVDTLQILLLLAIYSIFDPRGFATRSIVDMLCRQSMRLGLMRRDIADEGLNQADAEQRHRLFWSIYVIDRMIGVSTGMPFALDGVSMNIPLPGITVEEFAAHDASEYIAMLQVSRHVIHLRQLEDKVLREIHLQDCTQRSAPFSPHIPDRQTVVDHLRTDIEDWYSNGCLMKCPDPDSDSVRIHIRIPWLAARYYNLLFLLYYPSQNNPTATLIPATELASITQKHIQANFVRFQQRQLPLNHITLCRLLPVAMVFLYCFLEHNQASSARPASTSFDALQIHAEVSLCADMLEAFPKHWVDAHHAASFIRQLATLMARTSTSNTNSSSQTTATPTPASISLSETDRAWCHAIKLSLSDLMQQILGKGSAYRMLPEEGSRENWRISNAAMYPEMQAQHSAVPPLQNGIEEWEAVVKEGGWMAGGLSIMDFL